MPAEIPIRHVDPVPTDADPLGMVKEIAGSPEMGKRTDHTPSWTVTGAECDQVHPLAVGSEVMFVYFVWVRMPP